ncbi:MAG TPA: response regulator [Candidatus Acidoferrum sp.]|nr:response regulator [Candidatus Acidoferrum sp.]
MNQQATVYIVDDNEDHLQLAASLLKSGDWQVKTFASGKALLDFPLQAPGCVLLDNLMPELTGIELQAGLNERCQNLPVIFMSGESSYDQIFTATRAGAVAFLQKPVTGERLRQEVRKALAHSKALLADQGRTSDHQALFAKLTDREKEIFGLLVSGKHNKMIANTLDISLRTVEFHRANIQRKLNANFLSDLIAIARTLNL